MFPKSYKKVYFFYFFISNIQNTSSFPEANQGLKGPLAPERAVVGRG
jgi:hypothetical protein